MSGRKLKGYAVKLVPLKGNGSPLWHTKEPLGGLTSRKADRKILDSYLSALGVGMDELKRMTAVYAWRICVVAIYTKPKRTAAEERADTIAFLRTVIGPGISDALKLLESGVHEGASKVPCMVVYSDADNESAQLEALGRANG
jgi:hypothetical protein